MPGRYTYYIISCICLLLVGCDRISEDERLIYEKPEPAQRVVLLEDFTGQRCTNCPKATEVIAQLQETYGDALVAVGIHGGPLAFAGNAKVIGLKTNAGDEYYSHWNLEYQPVGLVNRHAPVNYPEWAAAVKEELTKPAPLRLGGNALVEGDAITIHVYAEGTDGTVAGKLQVWLLEDGIQTLQLMPDDYKKVRQLEGRAYVDFRLDKINLDPTSAWNKGQLSVVAFVYNDSGVQQAVRFN